MTQRIYFFIFLIDLASFAADKMTPHDLVACKHFLFYTVTRVFLLKEQDS